MPIIVKGEPLQRSLAARMQDVDDRTEVSDDSSIGLQQAVLDDAASDSSSSQILVDMDAKQALDRIQRSLLASRQVGVVPLADELSSVGSLSVSQYNNKKAGRSTAIPAVIHPRRRLSVDTREGATPRRVEHPSSVASSVVSPYLLQPLSKTFEQLRSKQPQRRGVKTTSSRPKLTVVTDVEDETREEMAQEREDPGDAVTSPARDDEPSRTLEDLILLLENGYRVRLHSFRGRESAFLLLHNDRENLRIQRESTPSKKNKKDMANDLCLDTLIEDIVSLEFGRRSDSGFLLSPLTSFSIGVVKEDHHSAISDGVAVKYFDLEAASPVQREVLVSTLMIMMDAFGSRSSSSRKPDFDDKDSEIEETVDKYEIDPAESGTFDQPIPCSPSLEAIPCSPSLEAIPCSPSLEAIPCSPSLGAIPCSPSLGAIPCSPSLGAIPCSSSLGAIPCSSSLEAQTDLVAAGSNADYSTADGEDDSTELFILDGVDEILERVAGEPNNPESPKRTFPLTRQIEGRSYYDNGEGAHGDNSSEATDQASNVGGSESLPVVTIADDLVIEAHLSDQMAVEEEDISVTEAAEQDESVIEIDPQKEETYIFKDTESLFSGSVNRPIDVEQDHIERIRSRAHMLSFSFSDTSSIDAENNESVRGMLYSVRSRRWSRTYDGELSAKPSYPSRILEADEVTDLVLDDSPSAEAALKGAYAYGDYRVPEEYEDEDKPDNDDTADWSPPQTSLIEKTAIVDIKPHLEVPTPHNLRVDPNSGHLTGGWCSDDVCTTTFQDMAVTCSGIFALNQTRTALTQASCVDPSLTDAQMEIVQEYITSALGAPSVVYSFFTEDPPGSVPSTASASKKVQETEPNKPRNRATRSNAQADRLRNLKHEMTFAVALKQSKERAPFLRATQSFDDAYLPKLAAANSAAQQLHVSPLLESLVDNMINYAAVMDAAPVDQETPKEEESVYYDSDPEDSRPRTMHRGPRKLKALIGKDEIPEVTHRAPLQDGLGSERNDVKLGRRLDEDSIKEVVQSMMNERLVVMWHPTQSDDKPNRAPILARLWIESGVYLVDGSFLLPKLSWVKAFGHNIGAAAHKQEALQKLDLLDICKIRSCENVDRSLHPFANPRLSWFIETQSGIFLFEAETSSERERIVYGLKLVVARLASLLMLRDVRAADEFFGATGNGVPGEAPVWTTDEKTEEQELPDPPSS
jgi:hypothetical protein